MSLSFFRVGISHHLLLLEEYTLVPFNLDLPSHFVLRSLRNVLIICKHDGRILSWAVEILLAEMLLLFFVLVLVPDGWIVHTTESNICVLLNSSGLWKSRGFTISKGSNLINYRLILVIKLISQLKYVLLNNFFFYFFIQVKIVAPTGLIFNLIQRISSSRLTKSRGKFP